MTGQTAGTSDLAAVRDARLVFVTGKGGTGKTSVAAALARASSRLGRRTLLCEVDAQRPAFEPIFGVRAGLEPVKVGDRLDVCNLVWPDVLATYLKRMVRVGWVVDAILSNDLVRRFLDFTPGAQDLVELSAIDDLCGRYDVVIVDMPASGHAFSLLDITRSALDLFRAGPVRQRATELRARVQARDTLVLVVALPEEMVVNETLETLSRLRSGGLLGASPAVVLNRCAAPSHDEAGERLLRALSARALDPAAAELVAAGRWQHTADARAADAIERLTAALGRPPVLLPPLGVGATPGRAVDILAGHVAALLQGAR